MYKVYDMILYRMRGKGKEKGRREGRRRRNVKVGRRGERGMM